MFLTKERVMILGISKVAPTFNLFKRVSYKQLGSMLEARDSVRGIANQLARSMELALRENPNFIGDWRKNGKGTSVVIINASNILNTLIVNFDVSTPDGPSRKMPVTQLSVHIDGDHKTITVSKNGKEPQEFDMNQINAVEQFVVEFMKSVKPFKKH